MEASDHNEADAVLEKELASVIFADFSVGEAKVSEVDELLASGVKEIVITENVNASSTDEQLIANVTIKQEAVVTTPVKSNRPTAPSSYVFMDGYSLVKNTLFATCPKGEYNSKYTRYVVVNYGLKSRRNSAWSGTVNDMPRYAKTAHANHSTIVTGRVYVADATDCGGSVFRYTFEPSALDEEIVSFAKSILNQLARLVLYYGCLQGDQIHVYFCTPSYGGWFHHTFNVVARDQTMTF